MDAWVWILLLVIVAAVVVAVVMSRSRQRENRRVEAAELRDPTADHQLELREKEAAAAASEAEARRVRAEADQRAAEAKRLEVDAQRAGMERDTAATTSAEKLRRADALDPDVATDKEGYRLDEAGNRIETPAEERAASGIGAPTAAAAGGVAAGAGAGGRSDEARAEHDQEVERVGNMRALDDDASDDESVDGDRPVDDDDAHKRGPLERARERVDEALGRRDPDPDPERRQPE